MEYSLQSKQANLTQARDICKARHGYLPYFNDKYDYNNIKDYYNNMKDYMKRKGIRRVWLDITKRVYDKPYWINSTAVGE